MVSRWVGEKKGKSQNSSKVTPLWVTEGTTEMGKSEYIVIEVQLMVGPTYGPTYGLSSLLKIYASHKNKMQKADKNKRRISKTNKQNLYS